MLYTIAVILVAAGVCGLPRRRRADPHFGGNRGGRNPLSADLRPAGSLNRAAAN